MPKPAALSTHPPSGAALIPTSPFQRLNKYEEAQQSADSKNGNDQEEDEENEELAPYENEERLVRINPSRKVSIPQDLFIETRSQSSSFQRLRLPPLSPSEPGVEHVMFPWFHDQYVTEINQGSPSTLHKGFVFFNPPGKGVSINVRISSSSLAVMVKRKLDHVRSQIEEKLGIKFLATALPSIQA